MIIGERLRDLRRQKNLTQGDIEKRSGLLRCYISRVENGRTTPALETIEKFARALEVPLYRIFYNGEEPPETLASDHGGGHLWGSTGKQKRVLTRFQMLLRRTKERDHNLLLSIARQMANARANDKKQSA